MDRSCADCGCAGRGRVRVEACPDSSCCCAGTPLQPQSGLGDRVRAAFESEDLHALGDLLAPNAQWGAPQQRVPTCQNRQQILDWYHVAYDAGARATVTDVETHGGNLVIGLHVTGLPGTKKRSRVRVRWQVLGVTCDAVTSICGFERKDDAVAHARSGRSGWTK